MGRLIHFEIHVDDMELAMEFYEEVSDGYFNIGVIMLMQMPLSL